MASYKKFLLPSAPLSLQPPPTLTTTTKGESMDHPLIVHIPLLPMQLHNKGERNVVGGCKKAVALKIRGPESPWSPHQRLPEYGRRHEGGASGSREMELASGSLAYWEGKGHRPAARFTITSTFLSRIWPHLRCRKSWSWCCLCGPIRVPRLSPYVWSREEAARVHYFVLIKCRIKYYHEN